MGTNSVTIPDSKVHGANMGPIWGQQEPGRLHVGPMNFAIWDINHYLASFTLFCRILDFLSKSLSCVIDYMLVT